jgi:hypothetical protein
MRFGNSSPLKQGKRGRYIINKGKKRIVGKKKWSEITD